MTKRKPQRITLYDATGAAVAQAEGNPAELVTELPDGDYTLELDLAPDQPEPERPGAPDGTSWATYLGNALGAWLDNPMGQPSPRGAYRDWTNAGRPE